MPTIGRRAAVAVEVWPLEDRPGLEYPDRDEFRPLLAREPLARLVSTHVLSGLPFVFAQRPEYYDLLLEGLERALGISRTALTVVGSARVGFSLSPDSFGEPFSEFSDIDVVVISPERFDDAWKRLLQWHYPVRDMLRGIDRKETAVHQSDIYWGQLRPHRLRCLPDVAREWFDAFQRLSRIPVLSDRKVVGRLYRTWEHARLYHLNTLRLLKERFAGIP
jgi:hypothetical protein